MHKTEVGPPRRMHTHGMEKAYALYGMSIRSDEETRSWNGLWCNYFVFLWQFFAISKLCTWSGYQMAKLLLNLLHLVFLVRVIFSVMTVFLWFVLTHICCPDDQYLSCVLIENYFVFIRIIRGKVFRYLYCGLSFFLLLNIIGVLKGANMSIFLF